MNFTLTKEQLLIQKAFRDFATTYIEPAIETMEKENQIPDEIVKGLAELDMYGLQFKEEYGGAGAGYDAYVLAMEQIARVSPGVSIHIAGHAVAMAIVSLFGTEEQKKKWMPAGCKGETIWSISWTEPGTGSDPKQLTTTARPEGDYYIVNGTKRFITNGGYPGGALVFARETDTGEVSCFYVDKSSEGYSISKPWEKIGQHGGPLNDTYFKDVKVPKENRVGPAGKGYNILQAAISFGKIGISSNALGSCLAAYEEAVKYAKEKTHRGEPIAKFQAIQMRVADTAITYEAARWMAYRLGCLANEAVDNIGDFPKESAMAKAYVCKAAFDAARSAQLVHSAYGTVNDYKITRILRDVSMCAAIEGVEDMQKIIAASYILRK